MPYTVLSLYRQKRISYEIKRELHGQYVSLKIIFQTVHLSFNMKLTGAQSKVCHDMIILLQVYVIFFPLRENMATQCCFIAILIIIIIKIDGRAKISRLNRSTRHRLIVCLRNSRVCQEQITLLVFKLKLMFKPQYNASIDHEVKLLLLS